MRSLVLVSRLSQLSRKRRRLSAVRNGDSSSARSRGLRKSDDGTDPDDELEVAIGGVAHFSTESAEVPPSQPQPASEHTEKTASNHKASHEIPRGHQAFAQAQVLEGGVKHAVSPPDIQVVVHSKLGASPTAAGSPRSQPPRSSMLRQDYGDFHDPRFVPMPRRPGDHHHCTAPVDMKRAAGSRGDSPQLLPCERSNGRYSSIANRSPVNRCTAPLWQW